MQFELHTLVHGFEVTHIYPLQDWNATLYQMKHIHSGAELCYLDRKEENKTFAIAFKTIPSDDTGVFHMLEHSCLNGSDRYPVKEPFVELLKSSMNTFLNAITYDDKTVYPVSSKSEKDFFNLMSVYLDAVFHPSIYHTPNIFYQEGWHYEIHSSEEELKYNGVVLNEMIGAFSSVDTQLITAMNKKLFHDSCYQYVSGGDPEHIPDLTYEQFLATHRKFYHPSNARIWLDGSMPVDTVLQYIDEEYLCHYEDSHTTFTIPYQTPLKAETTILPYEFSKEQPVENQCHVCYGKIVSTYKDIAKNTAYSILSSALTSSNESPLIRPFLECGLAQDVEFDIYSGIQQPWGVLTFRNTEKQKEPALRNLLRSTVQSLVKNGLDHEALYASINQAEFGYRESHEPSGIYHMEDALNSWLYEENPTLYLNQSVVFEELRRKVEEGYFEKILEDFLLDEDHLQTVIAVPDTSLQETKALQLKEKLQGIKDSWKEEETEKYITLNANLQKWQETPNSPEQLSMLPSLKLSDIPQLKETEIQHEKEISNVTVLSHSEETQGISYVNYYFNLAGIRTDLLPSISLFATLLAEIPTENHDVQALHSAIKRDIGTLTITPVSYAPVHERYKTTPLLAVRTSLLEKNLEKSHALVEEILHHTVFTRENILPILKQTLQGYRQALIGNGQLFASIRTNAHFSADGVVSEYTSGYSYGKFLENLEAHYEEQIDDFIEVCHLFMDNLFVKARLTLSVSENVEKEVPSLLKSFSLGEGNAKAYMHYPLLTSPIEGIVIPSSSAYSAFTMPLETYCGGYQLACHLLTYDWLWNEVRVKGGAYGTGIRVRNSGLMTSYSYRDPNPDNLKQAMEAIPAYLKQLTDSFPIDQYIIGTIGALDPLLSNSARIAYHTARYFSHIDFAYSREIRHSIVNMKTQDLRDMSSSIQQALEKKVQCVVAKEETLQEMKNCSILK